jgi:glycosidase
MHRESKLPQNWWESCSCVSRIFSRRDHIPLRRTIERLGEYYDQGIGALEIFAPYHGGNEYGALDPYNFYMVDPEIGTMGDFHELIEKCHDRNMAVIIFINVGYAAMENDDFIKAQDDVKNNIDSRETRFFLWDDAGSKPFERTFSHYFGKGPEGEWVYSAKAEKYYWVKWHGFANNVALPQYNFASREWQEECKKIVEFWMETGIDGLIIDAPFCYANCDFPIHNACITSIINKYPNQYIQPEGGGAAGEDPVRWITEAKYNSVQDYSMYNGWDPKSVISQAIQTGDASKIEPTLHGWRDRVAAAGGTTYLGMIWRIPLSPEQRLLEIVAIVTTGNMLHDDSLLMHNELPAEFRRKLAVILRLCAETPALRLNGRRIVLVTDKDCYAFKRLDDKGNEVLIVLNFKDAKRKVIVELGWPLELKNVLTNERQTCNSTLEVLLEPYGFAIYTI